jgi:hypothetical protein
MAQSMLNGRVLQPHAQDTLEAAVVEAPRFQHEGQKPLGNRLLGGLQRNARRAPQAMRVGDEIQPIPELHFGVVARVIDARRRIVVERAAHDRGEIICMDMVGIDIVLRTQHRRSGAQPRERQAVAGIDPRRAQYDEGNASGGAPFGEPAFGVDSTACAFGSGRDRPRFVHACAAAIAVHPARADVDDSSR